MGAQLSWQSICLTSRGSQVRVLLRPPFFWPGSSVGQNASLSRQRSSVRARSGSPFFYYIQLARQLSWQSRGLKIPVSVVRFHFEPPQSTAKAVLIFLNCGIEKEAAKFQLVRSQSKRRQKQSSGLFFRRGLPIPLRATTKHSKSCANFFELWNRKGGCQVSTGQEPVETQAKIVQWTIFPTRLADSTSSHHKAQQKLC